MSTQQGSGRDGHDVRIEHEVVLSAERLRHDVVRTPRERVRISKHITTEVRTLEVPVRVERLVVEREPVADPGRAAVAGPAEDPGELVVVLHEEVPVVSVQVRPTERVRFRVQRVTEERVVSDVLRHEEVDLVVEEIPPGAGDAEVRAYEPGTP